MGVSVFKNVLTLTFRLHYSAGYSGGFGDPTVFLTEECDEHVSGVSNHFFSLVGVSVFKLLSFFAHLGCIATVHSSSAGYSSGFGDPTVLLTEECDEYVSGVSNVFAAQDGVTGYIIFDMQHVGIISEVKIKNSHVVIWRE